MLLSICIPARNNLKLLKLGLMLIAESILGYEDEVEIIIGDNASTDKLEGLVDEVKSLFNYIKVSYYRNSNDIGGALNLIKVVNQARGKFVWLIGTDDFVYSYSVKRIIEIIKTRSEIDFIGLNFSTIDVNNIIIERVYSSETFYFYNNSFVSDNIPPIDSDSVSNVDQLVDPSYNSVMLGAMMLSVFRRSLWNQVDLRRYELFKEFNNLESTYPHIIFFATQFLSRNAIYISDPVIVVGNGARSWNEDRKTGPSIYIQLNIFPEIIKLYEEYGLDRKVAVNCKKYVAYLSGKNFLFLLLEKTIKNNKNPYFIKINLIKMFRSNLFLPYFHRGLVSSIKDLMKLFIVIN